MSAVEGHGRPAAAIDRVMGGCEDDGESSQLLVSVVEATL